MPREWVEAARLIPAKETAALLGMGTFRGRITPCRLCGSVKDKKRPRGPIGVYKCGLRWICNNCKAYGGSVDLASAYLFGEIIGPGSPKYADLHRWYESQGKAPSLREDYVEATVEQNLTRPPLEELTALMRASTPVNKSRREDVTTWLDRRGLRQKDAPCFVLPNQREFRYFGLSKVAVETDNGTEYKLWVSGWVADNFPVFVPLYDEDGVLCNFRARPIVQARYGKTRTARGFSAKSAIMADPYQGLRILRGQNHSVTTVVISEGDTDYLSFAQECKHDPTLAVFGIYSGAADLLRKLVAVGKWPSNVLTVCATDPDTAGDRYAAKVADALNPFVVKRANLKG